jgi:hypothetical protein
MVRIPATPVFDAFWSPCAWAAPDLCTGCIDDAQALTFGEVDRALEAALVWKGVAQRAPAACEHEWVDMRNSAIISGEMCSKCRAVRAGNEATGG